MYVSHTGAGTHRNQKRASDPETQVTGGCELPDVGTGNQTRVLCKSIKSSSLLSHLSNPTFAPF